MRWSLLAGVFGIVLGLTSLAAGQGLEESIAPDYVAFPNVQPLLTRSPDYDRYDLRIARKSPAPTVRRFVLTVVISRGNRVLVRRTATAAADGATSGLFKESALAPILGTVRYGRLRSLVPWEYDGFTFLAEVRENGPQGRVLYRYRDPDKVMGISPKGLFDAFGAAILGGLLAWFAGVTALEAGLRRASRRDVVAFAATILPALLLAYVGFTRYFAVSLFVAPLVALFIPAGVRGRLVAFGPLVEGLRRASWGDRLRLLSPAIWITCLTLWWLAWHDSLLLAYQFSPAHFREFVELLLGFYGLAAAAVALPLHGWLLTGSGLRWFRGAAVVLAMAFMLSSLMRLLDWGAFYYSAAHVDEDFWRLAFDPGNVKLFQSALAAGAFGLLAVALVGVLVLLRGARGWPGAVARLRERTATIGVRPTGGMLMLGNALLALLVLVGAHKAWLLAWSGPPREISSDVQENFAGVPEFKFVQPLVRGWLAGPPAEPPVLSAERVRKLERAGVRLYSVDRRYPLMKRSIYLDPASRGADKPRVPPGTNIIIITVESLSRTFMRPEVHRIPGLTPYFDDFRRHSLTFENLFSSDFPTIKGMIATFGSFAFDHRGLTIFTDTNNPLKSRYLFLSDVLRQRYGYETIHAQADLNSFGNTGSILLRHNYDECHGGESPDILRMLRHPITKPWGIFDEDLFSFVVSKLQHRDSRRPLYLTVAPTDMHFPYTNIAPLPASAGNDLLNSVHGTDKAFGIFWEYFMHSPYRDNTVVLLTADHAMATRALRTVDANMRLSEFDYLTGMLYVPGPDRWQGTRNDTICTQLDIAPTLLDMMDVDVENPFVGLSIFSERPRYPLAISREIPVDPVTGSERPIVRQLNWTPADQSAFFGLLRSLAVADRIRPADPAGGFR